MKNKLIAGILTIALAVAMMPGILMHTSDTAYAASYSITSVSTSAKKVSGGKVKITCTATFKCSSTSGVQQKIFGGSENSSLYKSWNASSKSQKRTVTATKSLKDYNRYYAGNKAQFTLYKGSSCKVVKCGSTWKKL